MRIIHLAVAKANAEQSKGVNQVVRQLAIHQARLGFKVSLWSLGKNSVAKSPAPEFQTMLFRESRNPFSAPMALQKAIQALPKTAVVHIHGAFVPVFSHVADQLYLRGINYVYTPHAALTQGNLNKNGAIKQLYASMLEKRFIRRARTVLRLRTGEYEDFDGMLKIPRKWLVSNRQEFSEIQEYKVSPREEPVFGFCGRLDRQQKGLDLILEGFSNYLAGHAKGRLEFIGDGKDRLWLEEAIRNRHLEEHVVLHGARFGEEKYQRLAGFDVFLQPSRMEGFPTAVLEAAAMRLPCITSEETSINEFIRQYDAGFPLPVNSPTAVADAMERAGRCWEEGRLPEKGENARLMVESLFHWPAVAAKLVHLYQS